MAGVYHNRVDWKGHYISKGRIALLEEAAKYIKEAEGLRLEPYKDTEGKATIGYGRLMSRVLSPDEAKIYGATKITGPITREFAEILFRNDLADAHRTARLFFGREAFDKLAQPLQIALLDLAFQMGAKKFGLFQPTLRLLACGYYHDAIKRMRHHKVAKQTPERQEARIKLIQGML